MVRRYARLRFPRGKVKRKDFPVLSDVPNGSTKAHPGLMRRFFTQTSRRYGPDIVRRYVLELESHLSIYAKERGWLSESVTAILMFPEHTLQMEQAEPYEIGACDSEILDKLKAVNSCQKEIYRFLFYRGLRRWYDAIEIASQALIEQAKDMDIEAEEDFVEFARRIEATVLEKVKKI